MSDVTRYRMMYVMSSMGYEILPHANGGYVLYIDYAALQREVAELKEKNAKLQYALDTAVQFKDAYAIESADAYATSREYANALKVERAAKEAAEQRCADLAKDAARYRWLVTNSVSRRNEHAPVLVTPWMFHQDNWPQQIDAHIDAALAASPQGSSPE